MPLTGILQNALKSDDMTKDMYLAISVYKDMKTWKGFAIDGCEEGPCAFLVTRIVR